MTSRRPPVRPWAALALALATVLSAGLVAGCANDAPADAAPELSAQLGRVDHAVVIGDAARIRERVEALVSATEAARDAGQLDDEQADRILAAADALLAQLPEDKPVPEPTPSPSPTTASPSPEEDDDEEHEEKPAKPKPPKPPKDEDHKGKGHKGD